MEQEIWITIRFKGYADAEMDEDALAAAVATHCAAALPEGNATGFVVNQNCDVLEVEPEAAIYSNGEYR